MKKIKSVLTHGGNEIEGDDDYNGIRGYNISKKERYIVKEYIPKTEEDKQYIIDVLEENEDRKKYLKTILHKDGDSLFGGRWFFLNDEGEPEMRKV